MTRAAIALALIAAAGLTACEALRDYHANNPDWGSNVPPYERIQFAGAHPTPDERARCEAAGGPQNPSRTCAVLFPRTKLGLLRSYLARTPC